MSLAELTQLELAINMVSRERGWGDRVRFRFGLVPATLRPESCRCSHAKVIKFLLLYPLLVE